MFCTACGKPIGEANAAFCPHCGYRISAVQDAAQFPLTRPSSAPGLLSRNFGKKCPNCQKRGHSKFLNAEVISRTPGYATVVRKTKSRDSLGNVVQTIERPEQIYVTRIKTHNNCHCRNCDAEWYTESEEQREGADAVQKQESVIVKERKLIKEKEVIRIPCRYCKFLSDPVRDRKCSNCGAPIL